MRVTTWCQVVGLFTVMTLPYVVFNPPSVFSQSSGVAGSGGSSASGSLKTATKPIGPKAGTHKPGTQPSNTPLQTEAPRERTHALEERLRSGQMEQPVAQNQISNRLEQLHGGSAEGATDGSVTGQSTR